MSLGKRLRNKRVHIACDKGNKKGVGHFVKYLCWWDELQQRVHKHLLDMDAAEGTAKDCSLATQRSLMKLGHEDGTTVTLYGQGTDSGGGGALENLATELQQLGPCVHEDDVSCRYLVSACSIHGINLQFAVPVKEIIGEGGLEKANAMQMLHSVFDLQQSVEIEEWRQALALANDFAIQHRDTPVVLVEGSDNTFATDYNLVKQCYPFEAAAIIPGAKLKGTLLEKVQAPALTRWWTVGVAAYYLHKCCLQVLKACQIIINRHDAKSRPWKIASGLCSLMLDQQNFVDRTFIQCFHAEHMSVHLQWLQDCDDLVETKGFQSHNMAVRFYLMSQDLNAMATDPTLLQAYHVAASKLDQDDRQIQRKKHTLFVKLAVENQEKHFRRWLNENMLPAALLSEEPTAAVVAAVTLGRTPTCDNTPSHFDSLVHGRGIDLVKLHDFIQQRATQVIEYTKESKRAARMIISGIDFRTENDASLTRNFDNLRACLVETFLPLPSHAQFVEFGVKEAKLVSQTDRSEQHRTWIAIVRSAHVTDAGNAKAKATNKDRIINRLQAAEEHDREHVNWKQQDPGEYEGNYQLTFRALKQKHFRVERVNKKRQRIEATANKNKKRNATQQPKQQEQTAAVTGKIPFGKLFTTKDGHMEGLQVELCHRGVAIGDVPKQIKARKTMLRDLEVQRLTQEEGMAEREARGLADKHFKVLSTVQFHFN